MLLSFVTTSTGHDAITTSLAFVLFFVNPFCIYFLAHRPLCMIVYFLFGFVVVLFCFLSFDVRDVFVSLVFVFFLSAKFSRLIDWTTIETVFPRQR